MTVEQSRPVAHKRAGTYRLLGKDDVGRHDAELHRTALCTGTQEDSVEQRGRAVNRRARLANENHTKSSRYCRRCMLELTQCPYSQTDCVLYSVEMQSNNSMSLV